MKKYCTKYNNFGSFFQYVTEILRAGKCNINLNQPLAIKPSRQMRATRSKNRSEGNAGHFLIYEGKDIQFLLVKIIFFHQT